MLYYRRACFGSTCTKIGTIQRRLAWPLRKDDTQIREAFQIFLPFFIVTDIYFLLNSLVDTIRTELRVKRCPQTLKVSAISSFL